MPRAVAGNEEASSDEGDSEMNLDSMVNNAVMYIASVDESHFPIKRADITKNALPPKSGKKFQEVMVEAKILLEKTFGLTLVELGGNDKHYVTVSKFTQPECTNLLHFSPDYQRKKTLLLIVLSYLYIQDNLVTEDALWKYLMQLKLIDRSLNFVHGFFGNVRRLCTTDLVRQMYIKMDKVDGTNPAEHTFMWGSRAEAEFSKLEILKFVAVMQSNIDPQRFTSHWSKLHGQTQDVGGDVAAENKVTKRRTDKVPMKPSQKREKK